MRKLDDLAAWALWWAIVLALCASVVGMDLAVHHLRAGMPAQPTWGRAHE